MGNVVKAGLRLIFSLFAIYCRYQMQNKCIVFTLVPLRPSFVQYDSIDWFCQYTLIAKYELFLPSAYFYH